MKSNAKFLTEIYDEEYDIVCYQHEHVDKKRNVLVFVFNVRSSIGWCDRNIGVVYDKRNKKELMRTNGSVQTERSDYLDRDLLIKYYEDNKNNLSDEAFREWRKENWTPYDAAERWYEDAH